MSTAATTDKNTPKKNATSAKQPRTLGENQLRVFFFKGHMGNLISKMKSGKLGLLNKKCEKSAQVKDKETWLCNIVGEKEKCVIFEPVELIWTAEENTEWITQQQAREDNDKRKSYNNYRGNKTKTNKPA